MRWKKRITYLLLAAMLAALCAGCKAKEAPAVPTVEPVAEPSAPENTAQVEPVPQAPEAAEPETDYTAVYAPVLDETCDILYNGYDGEKDYSYLSSGLLETVWYGGDPLESVGYTIEDLSGDGVPELLIGSLPGTAEDGYSDLFGGYTCKDGELICFLEGWARNRYAWMGGGRFFHSGSSGAMNSEFGTYRLSADGTELICEDFYFTNPKDSLYDVGLYHNTTGVWDVDQSEEPDISDDAFWQIRQDGEDACLPLPLTPFSAYEYTGGIRPASRCAVRVDYLDDVADSLGAYDEASRYDDRFADPGEFETMVVFRSDKGAKDFKLLSLTLLDVEQDGHAIFDIAPYFELPMLRAGVPLAVPMSFPGDIPNNGFSYVDEDGVTQQFSLSMSGFDGSLVILPLD